MLKLTVKPLIILFTIATSIGVLVHDTHIDKASTVALTLPVIAVGYGIANAVDFKTNDPHTHTETVTENLKRLVTAQPRLQTRFTDEKSYLSNKKLPISTTKNNELFLAV